jgi:hypothetical protein
MVKLALHSEDQAIGLGAEIGGDHRELFGYLIAALIVVVHTAAKRLNPLGERDVFVNVHQPFPISYTYFTADRN